MISDPVLPECLSQAGEGIFYADQAFVIADERVITFLKHAARSSIKRRARLCAHPSPQAAQQDMLIVSHRDTYVAPHRHPDKTESFVVIEGFADAILFDENGNVSDRIPMGPANSGRPFFYRMPAGRFHTIVIESEVLVFVESTNGPFVPERTENASWAPGPQDVEAGKRYVGSLGDRPKRDRVALNAKT